MVIYDSRRISSQHDANWSMTYYCRSAFTIVIYVSKVVLTFWEVVVAQLVERSLLILEVRSSNPVIGKNLLIY